MEFTFTPVRIGIFVSLAFSFWMLDGFTPPDFLEIGNYSHHRRGSWIYCPIMFLVGGNVYHPHRPLRGKH